MLTMCSAHCIYNRQNTLFLCDPCNLLKFEQWSVALYRGNTNKGTFRGLHFAPKYRFKCKCLLNKSSNGVFSPDVKAAILVSQNNETAAMLVSQTSPLGVELFCYANAFFCSNKFA